MFPWLGEDLKILRAGGPVKRAAEKAVENGYLIIDKFEHKVKIHPQKPFIIYEGNVFTYEFVDQQANKVARIVRQWGLSEGDSVALFFPNSPEYIWTMLGVAKLGVTAALINCNLHGKALVHSINLSESKYLIVDTGLLEVIQESLPELNHYEIYSQGSLQSSLPDGLVSFDDLMLRALPTPIHKHVRSNVTVMSTFCYVYTSGTTGLPKPCIILQHKAIKISKLLSFFGGNSKDIVYLFLPLYHSSGQLSWLGSIDLGTTIVLKKKFSLRSFWKDIKLFDVTMFQYIGELCRYLLSQPKDPLETQHKIKAIFGNGLRKDIWEKFQARFRIPLIVEFFGATEGTGFNCQLSNKPGAIGRLSPFLKRLPGNMSRIVKCDYETAQPIRDQNGRCIDIKAGGFGLIISGIPPEAQVKPLYKASVEANDKKIVRNAFEDGDVYFNYGDTVYLDQDYFMYFHDRLGDTFRWKGENVSTTEVANILTDIDFIHDANVYGVTVPGHDGKAGMAALTLNDLTNLDSEHLQSFYQHCEHNLPRYATPLFIRILQEAVLTATFKQRKVDLAKEGYDLNVVEDPLFIRDDTLKTYIPLTETVLSTILTKSKL
ncbi:hypothetical protein LOTGIDRAFT_112354 [Lottia gigantea]|uniref:long-chain-fatty-acid--CoA ligase n=1 Tax=Lottia gigantea TaxID=225164 RepID=V4A968_LOTGI|nr:hypothetical protein LOTGIDRAFT_112354 [Lottia gigantea]ESP00514.1 hypothetical protein LOTGIDRAFT_112354 [Lottia gigantea]